MPPTKDGDFPTEVNYLHIWPQNRFMMIALPKQGETFTLTVLMPYWIFDEIQSDEDTLQFFERKLPDQTPLIGKEKLIEEYRQTPDGDVISIKCSSYHHTDKVVIIGEDAHARVPFYNQGINRGSKYCLKLHEILEQYPNDIAKGLNEYSRTWNPGAQVIINLSLYNYLEIQAHVNSPLFTLQKH